MAFRRSSVRSRSAPPFPAATFALVLAACGGGDRDPGEAEPDTLAADTVTHIDPATEVRLVSPDARPGEDRFHAVEISPQLPADFPVPAEGIVVESSSQPIENGLYTSVIVVQQRDPRDLFEWYRQALSDEGWAIEEGRIAQPYRIEATKRSMNVSIVIQAHPEYPASGWSRAMAYVRHPPG